MMMRMRLGKMNLKRMMKMSKDRIEDSISWVGKHSNLEDEFEDGVDDYSPLYRDKTTFSDELEDE